MVGRQEGVVICLERGADMHMAQLTPLPLTVSCFSKIQIGFTFLVPAHLGTPGKRAVKRARARVCVCVRACVRACVCVCVCIRACVCVAVNSHRIDKYLETLLTSQTARKALPPTIAKSRNRTMADCPSYY